MGKSHSREHSKKDGEGAAAAAADAGTAAAGSSSSSNNSSTAPSANPGGAAAGTDPRSPTPPAGELVEGDEAWAHAGETTLVVEVGQATHLPKADVRSTIDPYLRLRALPKDSTAHPGAWQETSEFTDSDHPRYAEMVPLGMAADAVAEVELELWDTDALVSDKLLVGRIAVAELSAERETAVPLTTTDGDASEARVHLRLVGGPHPACKKTLFLIRHGESKWNEAQAAFDVRSMVSERDHPLNGEGVKQANLLRERWGKVQADGSSGSAHERAFLQAKTVLSSPLTRAFSTALVGLHGHPTMTTSGIRLTRQLREAKTMFGLDTVGKAFGAECIERAKMELTEFMGAEEAAKVCAVQVDTNDSDSPWWTPVNDLDTKEEKKNRLRTFFQNVRYNKGIESAICVGHSLFFRELCHQFLGPTMEAAKPKLAADLKKYKLNNSACLAIDVQFSPGKAPEIVDAELLFGTGLHKSKH